MIDAITHLLLAISNALLFPDILLLLALFVLTLLQVGGTLGEAVARRRDGEPFRRFVALLKNDAGAIATRPRVAEVPPGVGFAALAFTVPARHDPASREKLLDDLELRAARLLGRLHLGIRLGPVLGLAGTLIPLGPALVAMSNGDVAALSQKLVVAFATAVLGMFVGGACFVLHSVRKHWYEQDLSDIEFVLERTE
jgi:biopolymer transport protein ExbB/TolQ